MILKILCADDGDDTNNGIKDESVSCFGDSWLAPFGCFG